MHDERIIATEKNKRNRKMFMGNKARWHDVYTPNDGLLALLLFIRHVQFGNFPDHFHSSVGDVVAVHVLCAFPSNSVLMCYENVVYESIMSLAVDGNEMHVIFRSSLMLGMAWLLWCCCCAFALLA